MLMLNDIRIFNGDDVIITNIDNSSNALTCITDLAGCCTLDDGTRQGEWMFPNGSLVGNNNGGGNIYRTRGTQQVLLNRRNSATGPLGMYCCEVDTTANPNGEMICINMGK